MVPPTSDVSRSSFIRGRTAIQVRSYVWFSLGVSKSPVSIAVARRKRHSRLQFAFNGSLGIKTCSDGSFEGFVIISVLKQTRRKVTDHLLLGSIDKAQQSLANMRSQQPKALLPGKPPSRRCACSPPTRFGVIGKKHKHNCETGHV